MVCCTTLSFSSPLSPICLGNHAPRCKEKGRVREGGAQRKIQLTERERGRETGRQEGEGGMRKYKVTDFSRGGGKCLPSMK